MVFTYRHAPLEEALSIQWSHHSVIWFFSLLLHDHVASWKVWKRAFKMLPLWLSACACLWGGGAARPCPSPPRSRQYRDYLIIAQHSFFVHCWCSFSNLGQFLIMFSCSLLHTKQNFIILLNEVMIITLVAKSNSSIPFLKLALKSITL